MANITFYRCKKCGSVVAKLNAKGCSPSCCGEPMAELKGNNQNAPLPAIELSVKRPGFAGPAGEFVGRIRIRQEVKGKNYVICDILGNWEQDKLAKDDVIFAD